MATKDDQSVGAERVAQGLDEYSAQRRLAAIVAASGDAIISLTNDGVIETWNQSAERLYGYSAEEAVGKNALALLARDRAEREAMLARVAAGSEPAQTECQDIRKDGSLIDVSETNTPIRDPKGRVIGIARIARDVTTQVQAEKTMQKAEAASAEALDQALEASRMKSTFLANMSHEIRTPLNGVIGMAELLLDSPLNNEQRENARLLKAAGETLVTVVNDVLDFSKIEAGAMRLENIDFDLIEAVEDACDLVGETAREKEIELTMQLDPELPGIVRGDAGRVREVLTNLLSNALKFTSKGEICVALRVIGSSDDLSRVRFEVSDTGVGIEPSKLDQVFEPFVQADDSTTREYGGTGLGLAIVKQLVEMMGGEVGVRSVPGEGSSFSFTLAFERSEAPDESSDEPTLAGVRLLAVDDNETNRRLITQLGGRWNMHVTAVASGAEALARLREAGEQEKPFDCATLDMHMPDMDGIQLARAISRDDTFMTPALVMLASTIEQRRRARRSGIDVYMTKPIRRTRLEHALTEALGLQIRREHAPAEDHGATRVGSSLAILVAEDNDVNRLVAVRMLERRGYHAEAVENGRQALDALKRRSYAVVLMDCQMPELDGYDATSELRRREGGGAHTPVIAMTAHALQGDRETCLAAGMDDYLAKPLNTDELERILMRWTPTIARESLAGTPVQEGKPKPRDPHAGMSPLEPTGAERLRSQLGSTEALAALIELFATQTPELLADMRLAIEAGDGASVKGSAHKLKGSCVSLAATRMADLCAELETQTSVSLDGAAALVDELQDAFEETHAALLAELS